MAPNPLQQNYSDVVFVAPALKDAFLPTKLKESRKASVKPRGSKFFLCNNCAGKNLEQIKIKNIKK